MMYSFQIVSLDLLLEKLEKINYVTFAKRVTDYHPESDFEFFDKLDSS